MSAKSKLLELALRDPIARQVFSLEGDGVPWQLCIEDGLVTALEYIQTLAELRRKCLMNHSTIAMVIERPQ